MSKLHWLEVSEYVSLYASALGALAAATAQNVAYAATPLTIAIGLNFVNRERWKHLQEKQKQLSIYQLDMLIDPLRQRLDNFDGLTQNLSQAIQQSRQVVGDKSLVNLGIKQMNSNIGNQIADIQQHLAQLDRFTQDLSINTQKQLDIFRQLLNTNNPNREGQNLNVESFDQRFAELDQQIQQLSINIQQQIQVLQQGAKNISLEAFNQRFAQLDTRMQKLSINTQKQLQDLQQENKGADVILKEEFSQINNHIQKEIEPLNQRILQLNTYIQELSTSLQKQLNDFKAVIVKFQNQVPITTAAQSTIEPKMQSQITTPIAKTKAQTPNIQAVIPPQSTTIRKPPVIQNTRKLQILQGHTDRVISIAFSPDGTILASGSDDKTIKIWQLASLNQQPTTIMAPGKVKAVIFSPDGKILASGGDDKAIKLWDMSTGEEVCTLEGHGGTIYSLAFSPDSKTLVSGSQDKTIKLWSLDSCRELNTLRGHMDEVLSVSFSPNGEIITSGSGSNDQTIKVWYLNQSKFLTLKEHSSSPASVDTISFSPDGKIIASGSQNKTIKLWEAQSGEEIYTLYGHTNDISAVAFSPNGKTLASGSYDNTIKFWQVDTGREFNTFAENHGVVHCLAFSPDGKILASGNSNKTILLLPFEQN